MPDEFGPKKDRTFITSCIKEYVIIYLENSSTFSGRVDRIEEGEVILFPYQGVEYRDDELNRKLIEKERSIKMGLIAVIDKTTKKNIEAFCNYYNKREKLEDKKTQQENLEVYRKDQNKKEN